MVHDVHGRGTIHNHIGFMVHSSWMFPFVVCQKMLEYFDMPFSDQDGALNQDHILVHSSLSQEKLVIQIDSDFVG